MTMPATTNPQVHRAPSAVRRRRRRSGRTNCGLGSEPTEKPTDSRSLNVCVVASCDRTYAHTSKSTKECEGGLLSVCVCACICVQLCEQRQQCGPVLALADTLSPARERSQTQRRRRRRRGYVLFQQNRNFECLCVYIYIYMYMLICWVHCVPCTPAHIRRDAHRRRRQRRRYGGL